MGLKKMRFIKSLFLRHLISYIGAILIPVLILGYLTYSIFLGYYKQTLEENKMNALSSIRSTIDMQISNIHREAFRIGATGEFSTNYQTRSYAQFLDIVHDLNTTRFANDFVFDVHYINNDLGYVYTSNSRFTYDGYALFAKSYDGFTGDQIRGAFLGLNGTAWWPVLPVNKAQDRVLTYLIPLARDGRRVRSAALFQISENELDTMAGATISGAGSKLLIADGNNTLLYSSADEPLNLPDGFWGDLSKAGANT
ncbi:MAG: cache domain-containing protein, partial [Clostridiales bacterium]|nr:cache domain-containing protein [Clostridiales bacterium]